MGTYRYIVADTKTGLPLDELPIVVDSFSNLLGEGGTFTGNLPLGDLNRDWQAVTEPGKTSLYVLRDDNLVVWGGPIIGNPKNGDDKATITAETLEAFLKRRKIKTDLAYTAADVFDIVRDIINTIQGHLGGNLGLQVSSGLAGWSQSVAYKYEDRAVVWDEIQRLSEVGQQFEAAVTTTRDPATGLFVNTLNLAAPQLNVDLNPIVLEYPGNVLDYTWPNALAPNAVAGLGKGDGVSKLIDEEIDANGQIAAGYPLVDSDLSVGEEDDLTRLTTRTKIELAAGLVDNVVPQVTINGDTPGLEFGSFPLGIPARLRATSLYHRATSYGAPGLDTTRRVVGWSVKPPTGGGIEEVTLTLATGIGKIKAPLDSRALQRILRSLDRRLRSFESRR